MSQNITLGTATAAGGAAAAAVELINWWLPPGHQMPPDIQSALIVFLVPVLHTVGSLATAVAAKVLRWAGVSMPATVEAAKGA